MPEHWRVPLPPTVRPPFEVWINAVRQTEGEDYEVVPGALLFDRELVKEGKLGFWRWFWGAWGVGTYRRNDEIDVRYELDGRPMVAQGLDVMPPD